MGGRGAESGDQSRQRAKGAQPPDSGGRNVFGQVGRGNHTHLFVATAAATLESYVVFRYGEQLGKKCEQGVVGTPCYWRGGNAHLQRTAVAASEFAATGAGLHPKVEQQVVAVLAAITQFSAWAAASSGGMSSILANCRPNRTRIGDRSSPDMAGSNRLAGPSKG